MRAPTLRVLTTLCVSVMLTGCAVAGAGAGLLGQVATQAVGSSPSPSASPDGKASAGPSNKTNAGKPVDKVTVSTNDLVILVKRTQKAQATVTYLDGSKDGDIQWSTKDATIVQVNATTGEIAGVAPGTATIYARANADPDNKLAIINVTVKEGVTQDLSVSVSPTTANIAVGDTVQLNASVTNSNSAQSPNGSWSSSNQQVAFVNDAGLVTGIKNGKVTVTFQSTLNPTVKSAATVTVGDVASAPSPAFSSAPSPAPSTK